MPFPGTLVIPQPSYHPPAVPPARRTRVSRSREQS
jgi:hypothetical protein